MSDLPEPEILCERRGAAGIVTLNRPKALNALTLTMVRGLRAALDAWAGDPGVSCVAVRGAGEKAFCAGGDIRKLYEAGRAGRVDDALTFWREEYELNLLIRRYPKPYLALVDGICMGGGVGVSLHGSHRVAGERYLFAMPEVGIGFFPDVGATYALPRLPDRTGVYLALTGERVRAADALDLGLATHAVPSAAMPSLLEALEAGEAPDAALARLSHDPGPPALKPERPLVARCFAGESPAAILAALDAAARDGSAFAERTAATMRTKSPTSLRLAHEQMRRGAELDFAGALALEFRIVSRILEGHDFYEGVRATIIDKDGAPRWDPPTLDGVGDGLIAPYFADLGDRELETGS
jgi:enoyl-CoA hydratase